ncbi:thioredoxin-like protein 4A isoform X3 [Ursus americanus]|nr:thioredoxin-like protein 4A isoform X3 [Ursus americanus]XP_045646285.1 thioredoxin-like protein 4A isoform X3 [Ursus americanus]
MYELYDPCTVMFFFRCNSWEPSGVQPPAACGQPSRGTADAVVEDEAAERRRGSATAHRGCWFVGSGAALRREDEPPSALSVTQNSKTRNKHIMIDLGTGNNNKINWAMEDKQEMIDIIETVYRGARKGRGLVVSPKDYSTKYRY